MADVRLTAVNPENSEVYPVACNDKGELVLESATDLDVAVKLDVADTVYADNTGLFVGYGPDDFRNRTIRLDKDGGAQYDGVVQCGGFFAYKRTGAADQNIALFNSDFGGTQSTQFKLTADGTADFTGVATAKNLIARCTDNSEFALAVRNAADTAWSSYVQGDGSAAFASTVSTQRLNSGSVDHGVPAITGLNGSPINGTIYSRNNNGGVSPCYQAAGGDGTPKATINNDGSAVFSANVTAPNINFKLAPTTATTLPAPLIDEGFGANQEVDLLSELIKMKLQIRDLNAFMQRTLQDENETTQ